MENAWMKMKPAFTKHKNDNNGNCASIPRWMAKYNSCSMTWQLTFTTWPVDTPVILKYQLTFEIYPAGVYIQTWT